MNAAQHPLRLSLSKPTPGIGTKLDLQRAAFDKLRLSGFGAKR